MEIEAYIINKEGVLPSVPIVTIVGGQSHGLLQLVVGLVAATCN